MKEGRTGKHKRFRTVRRFKKMLKRLRFRNDTDRRLFLLGIGGSALILVCAICALIWVFIDYQLAKNTYTEVRERAVILMTDEEKTDAADTAPADDAGWDGTGAALTVDFKQLLSENKDTIAWLDVPAADISYPVLYAPDNDYYANRSFDGLESASGAIYLECTNAVTFDDRNSFIYGHNMRDKSMFGRLQERFQEAGVYEAQPYFYLYLPDGSVNRYHVYSYYETSTGTDTYSTFTEDDAYDYYMYLTRTLSETQETVEISGRPPIVTLSTCAGPSGTVKRFVVHGVLDGQAEVKAK